MSKIEKYSNKNFEDIKHIDENGNEFWYARELMKVLGYKEWKSFEAVIEKAKVACQNSELADVDHFVVDKKMVERGSGARKEQKDYMLSRYACYIIIQNANSRLKNVALAKSYFVIQTRKQEIARSKSLKYREDIDNMDSVELATKLFIISQTEQKLKKENIKDRKEAKKIYYEVGKKVRKAIENIGGTMPEDLPTPKKSLKELEKENKKV